MKFCLVLIMMVFAVTQGSTASAKDSQLQLLADSVVIQQNAIVGLERIMRTTQDPTKMASVSQKVIESSERLSTLQFQYANMAANAAVPPAPLNLTAYQSTLHKIIVDATTYLAKFPKMTAAQNILLTRAKTYQLVERNDLAELDYAAVAFSSPKNITTSTAAVSLVYLRYDLAMYEPVILTADKLQTPQNDVYYLPIQIKKAACLSKIGRSKEALDIITALNTKKSKMDQATMRDYLSTAVEVQIGAIHDQLPGVTLIGLVQFLKQTAPPTLQYAPLDLMATQLIRTEQNDLLPQVESFASELVPAADRTDAITKYLMLRLEHQFDQKLLTEAQTTMARIRTVVLSSKAETKNYPKLYRLLTKSLEDLRASRIKIGLDPATKSKSGALDMCLLIGYQLAIDIPEHAATDNYILHFNLAETAFRSKHFALATTHYQMAAAIKAGGNAKVTGADMKLISSRYQDLLAKNIFPEDVSPIAVPGKDAKNEKVEPLLAEWANWIDQKASHMATLPVPDRTTVAEFDYAAARAIYVHYNTNEALQRLMKIIQTYPTQPVALKAALLLFDTEVQSKAWEQMVRGTTTFLSRIGTVPGVQPELITKLTTYRHDADFEIIKEAFLKKDYPTAIARGNHHLETYAESPYKNEILGMLGVASVSTGDRNGAKNYFAKTDLSKATDETKNIALANEVDAHLHAFDWVGASDAYLHLMSAGSFGENKTTEKQKIAQSALEMAWISQNTAQLGKVFTQACDTEAEDAAPPASCADYKKWSSLVAGQGDDQYKATLPLGKAVQGVFAMKKDFEALKQMQPLWNTMSPAEKSALIPYVENISHDYFSQQREMIRKNSPIKLNAAAIQKRVKLLTALESKVETAKSFNWVAIQYFAMKTASQAYDDFVKDIMAIPAPKGVADPEKEQFKGMLTQNSAPFQKKSNDFEDAANALHPVVADNFNPDASLKELSYAKDNDTFKAALANAFSKRNAVEASYLLQQSQANGWLSPRGEKIVMGSILAMTGGYTESEAIFREAKATNLMAIFKTIVPTRMPASAPATTDAPTNPSGENQ